MIQPGLLVLTQAGEMGDPPLQLFVVVDRAAVEPVTPGLFGALELLLASFYTFDVKYPQPLNQTFAFLETLFGVSKRSVSVNSGTSTLISQISSYDPSPE